MTKIQRATYVELFSRRTALAAILPLAHQLVAGDVCRGGRGCALQSGRTLRLLRLLLRDWRRRDALGWGSVAHGELC